MVGIGPARVLPAVDVAELLEEVHGEARMDGAGRSEDIAQQHDHLSRFSAACADPFGEYPSGTLGR